MTASLTLASSPNSDTRGHTLFLEEGGLGRFGGVYEERDGRHCSLASSKEAYSQHVDPSQPLDHPRFVGSSQ